MPRRLLLLAILATLAACGDAGLSPVQRESAAAEARWRAQGLSRYTVEARILCFCPPVLLEWHELTVAADSVVSVRRVSFDGVSPPDESARPEWFRSVEQTFADVRTWPGSMRDNRLEARFDATSGLPLHVNFITGPQIADGGSVREFRALRPGLSAAVPR
jgi:hypothetical protein